MPAGGSGSHLWNHALIAEGQAHRAAVSRAATGRVSYQIQAAINAVHSDATTAADTDWRQILQLCDQLLAFVPGPIVALNRAVAVCECTDPTLHFSSSMISLDADRHHLHRYHLYHAIRAEFAGAWDAGEKRRRRIRGHRVRRKHRGA